MLWLVWLLVQLLGLGLGVLQWYSGGSLLSRCSGRFGCWYKCWGSGWVSSGGSLLSRCSSRFGCWCNSWVSLAAFALAAVALALAADVAPSLAAFALAAAFSLIDLCTTDFAFLADAALFFWQPLL